jgi:CBS domain-containing protein
MASKNLFSILESHTASHLITEMKVSKGVIEIPVHASLLEAAEVLWENSILGAPVWDETNKKYSGFFDMRDILSAVIVATEATNKGGSFNDHMVEELTSTALDSVSTTAATPTVGYLAARNRLYPCAIDDNLADICSKMIEHRCHRMPILSADESGKLSEIISQSALIKFLSKQISGSKEFEVKLNKSGFPYKKDIVKVEETLPAIKAFKVLDSHRLSGIAVVDEEDGSLVGNTSARDIKLLAMNKGRMDLDLEIMDYLAAVRRSTVMAKDRYPISHVRETDSLAHVIHMLAKTGYHRLFVVDEKNQPIGVMSIMDIVKFALSGNPQE